MIEWVDGDEYQEEPPDDLFAPVRDEEDHDETRPPKGSQNTDGRKIILVNPDEHYVNQEALDALSLDDNIYSRGTELVHIIDGECTGSDKITRPEDKPRIQPLKEPILREKLAALCYFYRKEKQNDGTFKNVQAHVPGFTVKAILSRGHWPGIRPLDGITEVPVIRPDGTIQNEPGYDPATRLMYLPTIDIDPIPDKPTQQDAIDALAELHDIYSDFPFKSDAHRSVCISGVLTPIAKHAYSGPAPLHLINGNAAGTGKGMSLDIIAIITDGRNEMPHFSNTNNDEEMRKRITAAARGAESKILIDNIESGSAFGTPAIDAATTSTVWKDRILGTNDIGEFPLNVTWYATGNNVQLQGDMHRRVALCRLETRCEKPEERDDFKYPNLLKHVRDNRGKYLRCALIILRAYFVAGRPSQGLTPWGSFQEWSDVVRNAIVWAGGADPGKTREELRASCDRDGTALTALVNGWAEFVGEQDGLKASEIVYRLDHNPTEFADIREALHTLTGKDKLTSQNIGYPLRKYKGRIINECVIDSDNAGGGVQKWTIKPTKRVGMPSAITHPHPHHHPHPNPMKPHPECHSSEEGGDGGDTSESLSRRAGEPESIFKGLEQSPLSPHPHPVQNLEELHQWD